MAGDTNVESSIVEAAVQFESPADRMAYLDDRCGEDAALRERVESRLAQRFALMCPDTLSDPSPSDPSPEDWLALLGESLAERMGRYKLLQKVGEGGCGVVYMAEQEEPVRRRVAVKVIKLGMDTKSVIARFEAERQALAMMDHPNIAKVLDAGTTDSGRPFFVMELVRGVRITDYCDKNDLSVPERLELFAQVCQAIQHAHQKGIIHRDVKPSNILVTLHDGVPVPKVIDFGIAKATTGQRLTDKTLFTALEQFVGTPAYMSPEQAEMSGLDIDTRTDIYSLGVLLYELLTSKTPFDPGALFKAGLDGMRRLIREQEPARPSSRLSTFSGADLQTVAKRRRSEPPKLLSILRGDLDWIVMKALEKDRTRRYESASAFALDVQNYLQHEPVTAAAPTALYRFRKFARRNRGMLATVLSVGAGLILAATVSLWLAVRATRAEKVAQVEAARSRQVATFLKDMLSAIEPTVAMGRDTTLLREILDRTAERVAKDLRAQPEVEAELETTLAAVYVQIAEWDRAEPIAHAAVSIREKIFGRENADAAESKGVLGAALAGQGKLSEAEATFREVLEVQERVLGLETREATGTLDSLARVLASQGQFNTAEDFERLCLSLRRKVAGDEDESVGRVLSTLSDLAYRQNRFEEAERLEIEAIAILRKTFGPQHPSLAGPLFGLGLALSGQRKRGRAVQAHEQSLALRRKFLGDEHPYVARAHYALSIALLPQGRWDDAEVHARESLAIHEKKQPDSFEMYEAKALVGIVLLDRKSLSEGEAFLLSGLEGMKRLEHQAQHQPLARSHIKWALESLRDLYDKTGRSEKATQLQQELNSMD